MNDRHDYWEQNGEAQGRQVTGNRAEGKKRRSLDCQHASSLIIAIAIAIDIFPIAIAIDIIPIAIDIAIVIAVTFSS